MEQHDQQPDNRSTGRPATAAADAPRVVVIGGGTAGAHASATLLRAGLAVTIVEPTRSHQFLTRLAAVAGGTQPPGDAGAPLDEMFDATVVGDKAVAVHGGQVILESGETLAADAVVLTAGAEPADAPIDGLGMALPLRSAAHALTLREAIASSTAITVVGGGPTGCQLAGAVASHHQDIAVTVVEGGDRLMGSFSERLGRHAGDVLSARGVEVRLGVPAERVEADRVVLADGAAVAGTPVWTGGYEATMDTFGPTRDGRLQVDGWGRVIGQETVYAAGDAAAHTDGSGELHAMSAQIAAQAGRQVARNVVAMLSGRAQFDLRLRDRGWVVDLGGGVGVAELLGLTIACPPADRLVPLLHTAIDLRNLFQLGGLDFVRRFRPGSEAATGDLQPVVDGLAAIGDR